MTMALMSCRERRMFEMPQMQSVTGRAGPPTALLGGRCQRYVLGILGWGVSVSAVGAALPRRMQVHYHTRRIAPEIEESLRRDLLGSLDQMVAMDVMSIQLAPHQDLPPDERPRLN